MQETTTVTRRGTGINPTEEQLQRGVEFAAWFRAALDRRGLTTKALADLNSRSPTYYYQLLNNGIDKSTGTYKRPSEHIIAEIARQTGADENAGRTAAGYLPKPSGDPSARRRILTTGEELILSPDDDDPDLTVATVEAVLKVRREERKKRR